MEIIQHRLFEYLAKEVSLDSIVSSLMLYINYGKDTIRWPDSQAQAAQIAADCAIFTTLVTTAKLACLSWGYYLVTRSITTSQLKRTKRFNSEISIRS